MLSPAERDRLAVVLVATHNQLNIGAAARAMSNFGILHLRLVNPYDPAFRSARSAVGALPLLENAAVHNTVAEAVADCSLVVGTTAVGSRELQHPLRRLEDGAVAVRSTLGSSRVALLFGSEQSGLSNDDLSHCHFVMRIPTREEHISMNLGQAVAVCLYELIRQAGRGDGESARTPELLPAPTANAGQQDRLTGLLFRSLELSGYAQPSTATTTELKLRRMVRRLHLDPEDADLLAGMLRQIVWKLHAGT